VVTLKDELKRCPEVSQFLKDGLARFVNILERLALEALEVPVYGTLCSTRARKSD
jgi:hypothetical protein